MPLANLPIKLLAVTLPVAVIFPSIITTLDTRLPTVKSVKLPTLVIFAWSPSVT